MSLTQKLQNLQNCAARVITFSNYDRSTDELLRMVNWTVNALLIKLF